MSGIIRKASVKDVDAVEIIYEEVHKDNENNNNYCNWDAKVYPLRADAERAEAAGNTFPVYEEDGEVLAAAIFNGYSAAGVW